MSRNRRRSRNEPDVKFHNFRNLVIKETFTPIEISSVKKIAAASIKILSEIGMSDAPKELCDRVLERGGKLKGNRLLYPASLIAETITNHKQVVLLAGQIEDHDLHVGKNCVYAGTGGAAPNLQSPKTNQ